MRFPALPPILLLTLFACKGDSDDTGEVEDSESGSVDDSDGVDHSDSVDDSESDSEEEEEDLVFPEDTFQLRVMNVTGLPVTVTGTDALGGAVDFEVAPLTLSDYVSLPVGTGTLTYGFDGYNQANFETLPELTRVVTVIGEVSGFTTLTGFREPARTPGERTLVVATTGRELSVQGPTEMEVIPAGEGAVMRVIHSVPNEQTHTSWYTYSKPFHFTMARLPEDGLGFVVNSDRSSEGYGKYYFARRSGPVQVLGSDVAFYAYVNDEAVSGAVNFSATTPFGELPFATNVGLRSNHAALPWARLPADTTAVTATDGTRVFQADFTPQAGVDHVIAVAHGRAGEPHLGFMEGPQHQRIGPDAYATLSNFTSYNVSARCYHGFAGWAAPGAALGAFLVAPRAALISSSSQACNLAVATPPAEPGGTPTHNFSLQTTYLDGYHGGFIGEDGAGSPVVFTVYTQSADANVYMTWAGVSPAQ